MYLRVSATSSLSLCAIKAMKTALMVLVKTALEFRNLFYLSQMVLFLNGNSGLCNWAIYKIVHKGPVAECFDELSKQVRYFLQQRGSGRGFCWITRTCE